MTPHKAQHIKGSKHLKKDTHIKQYPRIISGTHIQTFTRKLRTVHPIYIRTLHSSELQENIYLK